VRALAGDATILRVFERRFVRRSVTAGAAASYDSHALNP
jgi:hypothetical protein